MITNAKILFRACLVGCAICAATACSDTWDDHYEGTIGGVNEGTLWQAIQQNSDLSNFASVIEATGYQRSLGSSQVFTVFAPTNANFSKQEADELIARYKEEKKTVNDDDNTVIKEFIQNHIALYNHSVSPFTNDSIVLMNKKYALLKNGGIDNAAFGQSNTLYENGVLFIIDRPIDYSANVFEYIRKDADLDSVRSFLYNPMFYYKKFNAGTSVSGGLDELGRTIYLDSVFNQRNDLYDYVGQIASEDSTYWMVLPTNSEWARLVDEYSQYFVYDAKVGNRLTKGTVDSLTYTNTRLAILRGTAFSQTSNKAIVSGQKTVTTPEDSIYSYGYVWTYNARKNSWNAPFNYYQYYDPLSEGGIFAGTQRVACSNGVVLKASKWNIDNRQTFNRWIIVNAEAASSIKSIDKYWNGKDSVNLAEAVTRTVQNDKFKGKVWNDKYVEFVPNVTTQRPIFTFGIKGVLSNMGYDIYVVAAPTLANDSNLMASQCLPTKLRITLGYNDINGKALSKQLGDFTTTGTQMDYILAAENFKFPVATYGITESEASVTLKLENRVSNNDVSKGLATRTMCIDAILLVPHGTLDLTTDPERILMYPHGQQNLKSYDMPR